MPHKLTVEDLQTLNGLVQDGLVEVVSIDAAGEPSYRIASRFRNAATGSRDQPEASADQLFGGPSRVANAGHRADIRAVLKTKRATCAMRPPR